MNNNRERIAKILLIVFAIVFSLVFLAGFGIGYGEHQSIIQGLGWGALATLISPFLFVMAIGLLSIG